MERLNCHLDENYLQEPLQSAYSAKHSIETAMVKVFDDLFCTISDGKYVLLVLLDLSAEFDTIDHDVLMLRLQKLFGLKGDALQWLCSYFSNQHIVRKTINS